MRRTTGNSSHLTGEGWDGGDVKIVCGRKIYAWLFLCLGFFCFIIFFAIDDLRYGFYCLSF
jgi:hypothetical protein